MKERKKNQVGDFLHEPNLYQCFSSDEFLCLCEQLHLENHLSSQSQEVSTWFVLACIRNRCSHTNDHTPIFLLPAHHAVNLNFSESVRRLLANQTEEEAPFIVTRRAKNSGIHTGSESKLFGWKTQTWASPLWKDESFRAGQTKIRQGLRSGISASGTVKLWSPGTPAMRVWTDLAMNLPAASLRNGLREYSRILWAKASRQVVVQEGGMRQHASSARYFICNTRDNQLMHRCQLRWCFQSLLGSNAGNKQPLAAHLFFGSWIRKHQWFRQWISMHSKQCPSSCFHRDKLSFSQTCRQSPSFSFCTSATVVYDCNDRPLQSMRHKFSDTYYQCSTC